MFVDELKLKCKAGNGGNGIVSWLRFKYVDKGGPAGGDGGNGGDLYFRAVRDLSKLGDYKSNPKFKAQDGGVGMRTSKFGANGEDLYVDLPIGSVITDEEGNKFQLLKEHETKLVLKGGRAGHGNEYFKSSRNVAPDFATDGKPGEEMEFKVELEMLVDIGLIGLPSAGKSSLMNTVTKSTAKVGDYPFTTLEPNLGEFFGFILADIPGLIEGASEGKGLGHKFLRHIKRTKALGHLVSLEYEDPIAEYEKIRKELEKYSPDLIEKDEIIVLSKTDLVDEKTVEEVKKKFEKYGKPIQVVSIINDEQVKTFTEFLVNYLKEKEDVVEEEEPVVVY